MSAASAVFLLVVLAVPAAQQEPETWDERSCVRYTREQLDAGEIPIGRPAYVDLKYASRTGRIRAVASETHLRVSGVDARILTSLRNGDNIRVFGLFQGPPRKLGKFDVHHIVLLPSDEEEYEARRNKISSDDVPRLLDLADWAMERYRVYESHAETLRDKARRIYNNVVQILEERADREDYDAHFEIAKIILEKIGDRGRALDKLKESCLQLRPDDADLKAYIRDRVGGVWYRDDWVKYEDFKTAEGFLKRSDGTWVRAPVYHLEKFVESAPEDYPGTVGDAQARGGMIKKGMEPYQMIWAKGGYPEYILRIAESHKAEVWVYSDGYYLFWKEKYHKQVTRGPE